MNGSKNNGRSAVTILRSIWAVVAGYLTLSLLVIILLVIAVTIVPQWKKTADGAYLATNLMLSVVSAAFGGYVCARLSPDRPLGHALALGLVTLVLGVLYALSMPTEAGRAAPPGWYGPALAVLALPSVLLGALVFTRTHRPAAPRQPDRVPTASP
ncbi:hypothetical protein KDL29_02040 [bacterium]|nr:hypothetical protein [bacterium]